MTGDILATRALCVYRQARASFKVYVSMYVYFDSVMHYTCYVKQALTDQIHSLFKYTQNLGQHRKISRTGWVLKCFPTVGWPKKWLMALYAIYIPLHACSINHMRLKSIFLQNFSLDTLIKSLKMTV